MTNLFGRYTDMKHKSALFAALGAAATCFIFRNSLQNAAESSASSGVIVNFVIREFARFGSRLDSGTVTVIVRKLAHIAEFFMQGFFISLAYFFGKSKFSQRIVYVLFFGLITACTDELIQNFVSGRGSLVTDIWIDFIGVLLAALCYFVISALSGKRRM